MDGLFYYLTAPCPPPNLFCSTRFSAGTNSLSYTWLDRCNFMRVILNGAYIHNWAGFSRKCNLMNEYMWITRQLFLLIALCYFPVHDGKHSDNYWDLSAWSTGFKTYSSTSASCSHTVHPDLYAKTHIRSQRTASSSQSKDQIAFQSGFISVKRSQERGYRLKTKCSDWLHQVRATFVMKLCFFKMLRNEMYH